MEAVFRAALTDVGNLLDRFTHGRDFGLRNRRRRIDGERCLDFGFVLFGIKQHFDDRRPVAGLAGPAVRV